MENFVLDDETEANITQLLSTTISSIDETTQDDDDNDDDEAIPDHEKRDEINDSKENARLFFIQIENFRQALQLKMFIFIFSSSSLKLFLALTFVSYFSDGSWRSLPCC